MTWHHWALCADSDLEPAAWTDRADDMQWGRSDANRARARLQPKPKPVPTNQEVLW